MDHLSLINFEEVKKNENQENANYDYFNVL